MNLQNHKNLVKIAYFLLNVKYNLVFVPNVSAQDSASSSTVGLLNALGIMGVDENTGKIIEGTWKYDINIDVL